MTPLLERIATNLRSSRERQGLSREELAASAAIDPQMIKRIENGRANPALVVLSRLAAALMVSLSLLVGEASAATQPLPLTTESIEPLESEAIGETIASLRKQRNLSRRAFARLVDVRNVTLARYETAAAETRILALESMARALSLSVDEVVREIERRQQTVRSGSGWQAAATGTRSRLVSVSSHAELWEWRLAPSSTLEDERPLALVEEIATAIRGEIVVRLAGQEHRLHRGGSVAIAAGTPRSFTNNGQSTARLLRFVVL